MKEKENKKKYFARKQGYNDVCPMMCHFHFFSIIIISRKRNWLAVCSNKECIVWHYGYGIKCTCKTQQSNIINISLSCAFVEVILALKKALSLYLRPREGHNIQWNLYLRSPTSVSRIVHCEKLKRAPKDSSHSRQRPIFTSCFNGPGLINRWNR